MGLTGMEAERRTRLEALVEECRGVLDGEAGMDGAQEVLSARGVGVIDSIIVTRELLGAGEGSLGEAKRIVLSAPSRHVERERHTALVHDLLHGLEHELDV